MAVIRYCELAAAITVNILEELESMTNVETGALPQGGLGWTCPPHFCWRVFLRLMQIR